MATSRRFSDVLKDQTVDFWLKKYSLDGTGTGIIYHRYPLEDVISIILAVSEYQLEGFDTEDSWSVEVYSKGFMRPFGRTILYKTILKDILYRELVEIGKSKEIIAIKWIPVGKASFEQVKENARQCRTVNCIKRCAKYGCICIEGKCR